MTIYNRLIISVFLLLGLSACTHKETPDDGPPPQNLPTAPNCAADGPDCKQFNPDLKN